MAVQVRANFVFTEDDFENLSFDKQGDIIEQLLMSNPNWEVEILGIELEEVNVDSDD